MAILCPVSTRPAEEYVTSGRWDRLPASSSTTQRPSRAEHRWYRSADLASPMPGTSMTVKRIAEAHVMGRAEYRSPAGSASTERNAANMTYSPGALATYLRTMDCANDVRVRMSSRSNGAASDARPIRSETGNSSTPRQERDESRQEVGGAATGGAGGDRTHDPGIMRRSTRANAATRHTNAQVGRRSTRRVCCPFPRFVPPRPTEDHV